MFSFADILLILAMLYSKRMFTAVSAKCHSLLIKDSCFPFDCLCLLTSNPYFYFCFYLYCHYRVHKSMISSSLSILPCLMGHIKHPQHCCLLFPIFRTSSPEYIPVFPVIDLQVPFLSLLHDPYSMSFFVSAT